MKQLQSISYNIIWLCPFLSSCLICKMSLEKMVNILWRWVKWLVLSKTGMKWSFSSQVCLNLFGNIHLYMLRSNNCILRTGLANAHTCFIARWCAYLDFMFQYGSMSCCKLRTDTGYITLALWQLTYCSLYSQLNYIQVFFCFSYAKNI